LEKQIVFDTLERCGNNQGKAAEALGHLTPHAAAQAQKLS